MLEQPDNLDVAFEYAALSAQAGDLEGAISTLERMLIFAPGLPRLQLELGVLYYRLGSMETARSYFESAIASPGAPAEVVAKVKVYLAAIDRSLEPTTFSGALFTGIRWQSNANAAPDASEIILNGLPFILGEDAVGEADWSIFSTGSVAYRQDLENQGDRLEFDAYTYSSFQFEQTQLNTHLIEATVGPAFNMGRFGWADTYLGLMRSAMARCWMRRVILQRLAQAPES
jgi:tetratricopeptide (TPR) repeat protein